MNLIAAELIQASSTTLHSEIHKVVVVTSNEEDWHSSGNIFSMYASL
jgi:hypothetical protein